MSDVAGRGYSWLVRIGAIAYVLLVLNDGRTGRGPACSTRFRLGFELLPE